MKKNCFFGGVLFYLCLMATNVHGQAIFLQEGQDAVSISGHLVTDENGISRAAELYYTKGGRIDLTLYRRRAATKTTLETVYGARLGVNATGHVIKQSDFSPISLAVAVGLSYVDYEPAEVEEVRGFRIDKKERSRNIALRASRRIGAGKYASTYILAEVATRHSHFERKVNSSSHVRKDEATHRYALVGAAGELTLSYGWRLILQPSVRFRRDGTYLSLAIGCLRML